MGRRKALILIAIILAFITISGYGITLEFAALADQGPGTQDDVVDDPEAPVLTFDGTYEARENPQNDTEDNSTVITWGWFSYSTSFGDGMPRPSGGGNPGVSGTSCNDKDGDGFYGYDSQYCSSGTDCNDSDSGIKPGANDVCDGLDNDCDGNVDEGIVPHPTNCGIGQCASTGELICRDGELEDTCVPGNPADEECEDGLDNDCDGYADCEDPDCGSEEEPPYEGPPAPEFAFLIIPIVIMGFVLAFSYKSAKKIYQ